MSDVRPDPIRFIHTPESLDRNTKVESKFKESIFRRDSIDRSTNDPVDQRRRSKVSIERVFIEGDGGGTRGETSTHEILEPVQARQQSGSETNPTEEEKK